MGYSIGYITDVGSLKKTNQDALLIKTGRFNNIRIGLFVVADGMGGMAMGEVASSTIIVELGYWFDKILPIIMLENKNNLMSNIKISIKECIVDINNRLSIYGKVERVKLGSTVSALLVINEEFYIAHVGDSRIYKINNGIKQLTWDQTYINREIKIGRITDEEAKSHPKRNALIECVGITNEINILEYMGHIETKDIFILCTDGFYKRLKSGEFEQGFNSNKLNEEALINKELKKYIDLVKLRGEKDNISAIVINFN